MAKRGQRHATGQRTGQAADCCGDFEPSQPEPAVASDLAPVSDSGPQKRLHARLVLLQPLHQNSSPDKEDEIQ